MNNRQREDLDRYITGHYGEGSVPDEGETMTIDDYAREKAQQARPTCLHCQSICLTCVERLLVEVYKQGAADQKRGAVAAILNQPKIIVICGSSRFCGQIAVIKWELEKQGNIAIGLHLLPHWYGAKDDHQAEAENAVAVLDELHLRKIDLADEVFIANCDGYIGERTRFEIQYAEQQGKPVRHLEPISAAQPDASKGKMEMEDTNV